MAMTVPPSVAGLHHWPCDTPESEPNGHSRHWLQGVAHLGHPRVEAVVENRSGDNDGQRRIEVPKEGK